VFSLRYSYAFALLISAFLPVANAQAPPHPHIVAGSRIFIEPMNGFETDLAAAVIKKHVPVMVVDNEKNADYIITGSNETIKAGWAKTIFITPSPADHASITVTDPVTGQVVYAYAWDKLGAIRGSQSAAEGIAKHLKNFIDKK
jgi:uncharacterized protein (DUF736 family)